RFTPYRLRVVNFPMAEDDQVNGRLPDELAERLGQAPPSMVRPSHASRRKSLSPLPCDHHAVGHGRRAAGRMVQGLSPYMNLLPAEIIMAEEKEQQLLCTILEDVGRHAYAHLVKYLSARPGPLALVATIDDFIPPPPNQIPGDQMVMLSECLDDAVDSIRDIASHPGFKDTSMLMHASRETIPKELQEALTVEMITPEMGATALTLLTASAFRRPPTRMVESMMAASQEAQTNGADGDSQREGTEGTADDASVQTAPASDDGLLGLACSTGHDFLANVNHPHGLLCAAVKAGLWELAMLMVRVRQSGDFMGESECTPLMEACAAGHEKIVRQMIPYAEDLNTQSATQNTALIYASAAGHLDCVEVLLEAGETRGIDLDLKNENGHCALMEAAAGGHLEIVKRLIGAGSGSLRMNVNSEFKESPLTLASYKGHKELVMYLLTLDLGDTREEELHTALMEASMDGHIEVADILLKDGAPVNLPSDSFESPLTLAACGGHVDLVKLLLDAGANIEEPNDESYTPLMEAAREGHADVVRMLLDAGANVDATTEETGETAMTLAACGGFTEIVEMILEAGGDLELGANTPLMEAATEGHHHTAAGIIRMMKERKHDKDQAKLPTIQKNVSTALVQAADNGHYQITRELASSGFVDLNFQLENRTALMKAAKGGYRDIIRFLVQAGADVNLRSATADVTALSLACAGGHYDTVSELLLHHADPNVILKDGVTCVLEAARHGYVHIVELLLDYRGGNSGPKPNRKVATPRRQMAKRTTPASPAAKAVAAGAAAAAAAPAAKVVVDGAPSARPVRPMLLDSDSDSGSDYEVVASPAFPYHAHDGHEHVWEGTSCSRHAHLSSTAYWQQRQQNHHHHHHHHHQHHAHHHSSSSSHSAAAHAQHNAELHSALFGAYDGSCELPPLLQHQPQPAASPKVPTQLSPAGKLLYEELRAEQAAAAKVLRETGRPSEDTDAAALKTLLEISPEMQEKLFADLDAGAPGANFQNALVRTFLADETIVQRLAAGDTVSLNTKTGETSAGVYLPVAGVVEQVNRKVKGSLAAMRKAKKEAAAARAEARLTVADEDRLRAIEDDAVNAIRETFMVAKAQLTAAQTALDKKETAAQVVDAVRKAATEQIGSAFPSTLVPPSAFPSSMPPTSAFSSTMAPTSAFPSAMVPTTAFPSAKAAAAAAATPLPTKEQAAATINAAAAAAPKTKDPGAQASDMMKAMAQHLVMPQKDSVLDPSQVESFHKFHDFLVRTAKGDNPPASTMGGSAFSSKDGTPYEPASEGVMHTLSDELRGSLLLEQCDFDPSTVAILDRSLKAVAVAAASANPAAALARLHQPQQPPPKRTTGGGGGQTIAEIIAEDDARLSSLSPSPAPSSPALPMMTASSDEFVSDTRQPVTVRRRSASVPHNSSDGRWPFELTHKHDGCELAKRLAMQANNKQTGGGGTGGAGGDAGAPPPAKRATGANRQGGANARTGTVEKRPLAATSTFDVDMQTESNADTPLTLACSNGHTAMVELLITRGANVHHRDKKGFTPLILAATGGHLQIVQVLLDHGANIETTSERTKDTALSLACSGGKKEVAEMLLKRGANKEHRNVSDYTPLSLAASGGYVDICNMLLDAGAEINSRTGSKLGISPLMLAAMNGHRDATRVLLERGSDINAQIETNRNTALTLACFQGRTDVVRLLLQYHANVEHRAKTGLTPLMEAANGGYVEVGQLLLEHYADPNTSPVPSSRDTALTIAADKGHEKFVDLLLKNGAQVDARNKKGCTALWLACHGGHLETVQTLVKHKKTNVEMEDNRKVSPLMIAFRKGHTKIVKFLVKAVSQFPGDAELCRYIQTVTEQDLMTRCHECMNTIVTAKDKQAAQANLAADALIAQIEAEEEQARSKKLSKQRQKEKKKQKKQEKKKQEVVKEEDSLSECSEYNEDEEIDVVTVDEPKEKETTKGGKKKEAVMVKEESKKVEEAPKSAEKDKSKPAAAKAAAAATPLAAASAAKGKARAAAAAAVSAAAAAAAAAPAVEKTPEREPEKVEERIPGMSTQQPAAAAAAPAASVVSDEAAAAQRKTAADRRAASRRSVAGKNGPISTAVPTSTNALPSLMTTNIPPPPAA
ncbi:mask-1, partial [Pristionchus pacificus]